MACFALASGSTAGKSRGTWVFVSAFQSGEIAVIDLDTADIVDTIPVDDGAGLIGLAASPDGASLYVVDGRIDHRLRVFDSAGRAKPARYRFENRVLNFGGVPIIHASRDGRWLFIYTYNYAEAAHGVRLFDTVTPGFVRFGLRNRPCAVPRLESAGNGKVVAVCPGNLADISPNDAAAGNFSIKARATMTVRHIADQTMSPAGDRVYVVGAAGNHKSWRLVDWDLRSNAVAERGLASILGEDLDIASHGRNAWLEASPNGRDLALAHGRSAWIIDRNTLRVRHRFDLGSVVRGMAFSPDGEILLTLHAGAVGGNIEIGKGSAATGKFSSTPVALKIDTGRPIVFEAAPAP